MLRSQWPEGKALPDEVGVSPAVSPKFPNISIPYGALVPEQLEAGIGDIAVASRDAHSVYILIGEGRGSFNPLAPLLVERWPTAIAVGDFNRDGVADMAVAHAQGVSILLGSGQGEFRRSGQHSFQ